MYSKKLLKKLALITVLSIAVIIMAFKNKPAGKDGWKDLFDGKTMNGWKVLNQDFAKPEIKPDFYIENNMIICNSTTKNKGGGYLITEKSYSNFILELDVKIDTTLNSGVQCRSRVWEKDTATYFNGSSRKNKWPKGYVWGYQIEIDPTFRAWSGGLYEPGNRGWLVTLKSNKKAQKAFKPLDWNHFKILMDGNKIQTWVNNIPIVDTTDNMSSSGFIGLQFHGAYTEIQNNKKSMFKNIRIKEL
jgi:hypothetical protein